jgi:hypothetical protein
VPSWDRRSVAFQRRVKTEPSSNVGALDLETRKVRVLTHEADSAMTWQPVAFSRDGDDASQDAMSRNPLGLAQAIPESICVVVHSVRRTARDLSSWTRSINRSRT